MGLITTRHHVADALRFHAAADKYFGIGRTTAWTDDADPPPEDPDAVVLEEVVGYKSLSAIKLLKPDAGGAFDWGGQKWTEVTAENARAQGATYVYVEARLEYAELPLITFRQVGIFTGLVRAGGAPATGPLLPAQVTSPGDLEALDNRTPVLRAADKVDVLTMVLSF